MTQTKNDDGPALIVGIVIGAIFAAFLAMVVTTHIVTGHERNRVCKIVGGSYNSDAQMCINDKTITYKF